MLWWNLHKKYYIFGHQSQFLPQDPKVLSISCDDDKAFDCVDHNKLWKFFKRWEYQTTLPAFWETCTEVKKQQLELVTPTSAYTQSHNRPGRTLSHCILVASMALTHTTCCTQLPPLRDWGHCSIQGCHRPVEARGRHPHEAWNHRLVLNQESSTSRLYIVTLLI